MQDLIEQEKFELEVLDTLNSKKLLSHLVFIGGTMLRLCYGLTRFSVDLDFWVAKDADAKKLYKSLEDCLSQKYTVKDSANKFYTLLFEVKSKMYPRSLKIEIRKEAEKVKTEQAIAYSKYSNTQVYVKTASLKEMMNMKMKAFLSRKEIRDIFDIEFLIKKGVALDLPDDVLKSVLNGINSFAKKDYRVKLGQLLEPNERRYYTAENFKILKAAIQEKTR